MYSLKLFMLSLLRLTEVSLKLKSREGGCGSLPFFTVAGKRCVHLNNKSDLR